MSPGSEGREDLQERLRVLGKENELLAERAEEISMLGLVAEQMESESDSATMLSGVLERICILKAIPFGACLRGPGPALETLASYHVRRAEALPGVDRFRLREAAAWPPAQAQAGASLGFEERVIAAPGLGPAAFALIPLRGGPAGLCLLFLDDRRGGSDLAPMLPALARVADLVGAKLVHLALIRELQDLNRTLDLKVAERTRELRLGEARYRTLFEHVPDAILLVDADDEGHFGRIEDANEVAASLYGYSLEALRKLDIEALNAPGAAPGLEAFEARVWRLKEGETVREERLQRREDGSTFPVEAIGTLVRVHEHPYVLGFFRDLTERKEAEELLLAAQRTESLGVLAGGIAHDFNNLLTAIIGQTGIALEHQDGDGPARAHLERSLDAAERAALLTRQMLAYAGRGRFSLQALPVNQVIRENVGLLEAAIPKQVQVDLDLEEGLPGVTGDLSQFQQVIMNLVLNGVQAIGGGPGQVRVRTRLVALDVVEDAQWPLGQLGLPPGVYVRIEVEDSGCGMSPEVRARIFEPFFTTKAQGHGLGLSAVQGIIRGHRGGLGVDSLPGAGTTFRVLLPAAEPAVPETLPAPPVQTRAGAPSRVVLVIDDESYMLEVVRDILESAGHVALLASSGEEGLDLVRQRGEDIDFVLLDLSMPGIGGVETFRRLRALPAAPRVVLTSGFAQEEALAQLEGMAMTGFLQKPYRVATLLAMVASLSK